MLIWSARGWLKEICSFIKSTLLLLLITSFMTRYCFISEYIHSILGAHETCFSLYIKCGAQGLPPDRTPMEKGLLNWLRSSTFDEVYLLVESHYNAWQPECSPGDDKLSSLKQHTHASSSLATKSFMKDTGLDGLLEDVKDWGKQGKGQK